MITDPMRAKIAELVARVVADDNGSCYVTAHDGQVGVCYESFDPDQLAEVEPTDEVLAEAARQLDEAGHSCHRDAEEWREQLNEWCQMGGGSGDQW